MREVTLLVPSDCGYDIPVGVDLPVTTMHIVWEDSREGNPDVFYGAITIQPGPEPPYDPILTREGQEKVNQNDERAWQTEPPWQGEPGVAATGSGLTLAESEGYNAFVVWADGRNYGGDFDNLDIYFRLFSNVGAPTQFVGGNNVMVNSNARLHDFDENIYDDYRRDIPPHARQRNPSIASTLIADWPTIFGGYLYVVWDDDRILNPFTDRNIYISRSNLLFGGHGLPFSGPGPGQDPLVPYGAGAHVSEVFDSGAYGTTWYIVDWHGVTDSGTYVTLQTRLGDTRAEVLSSDWYPHVPQQSWPYPDDAVSLGAPLEGYDAPGQHIVDENGDWWPQARYIQYRVNFWARDVATDPSVIMLKTPFLFDVILHYQLPPMAYLPLVFKGYSAP
jgi:hypothetical protein